MLQITEKEIKKRLAFDNPWWETGEIDEERRGWSHRAYFQGFAHLVQETEVNRAVVLMGPRRVGKTVMLTQAIQKLLDDEIDPKRICYVSVDTPTYTGVPLERLLRWFMEIHGHDRSDRLFVFFDEIQYHPDWERHLKSLVDSFPVMRFIASGSAAAALKMKSIESGAGRFTDFLLPPLNFAEFIHFVGLEEDLTNQEKTKYDVQGLNRAFVDYINFGGFPEAVIDERIRSNMDRFIANDIVDKVLLRDLPSLYGISDAQELKRLFTVLAYNTGQEVSYEGLSQTSGVSKNTLRKYLDYFEAAFLIHRLYRIDQYGRRFKRVTHFKVYLTNACIRSALFGPIGPDDPEFGSLVETAVMNQLAQSHFASVCYYARWKTGEVDLVHLTRFKNLGLDATEIKWSDRFVSRPDEELKSLVEFCKKNDIPEALVYSRTAQGELTLRGIRILYGPVSVGAYLHGWQTSESSREGRDPKKLGPILREIAEMVVRSSRQ